MAGKNDSAQGGAKHHSVGGDAVFNPMAMMEAGRPASTPIEAWISLFPTSPLFGVRWAMWDLMRAGAAHEADARTDSRPSAAREAEALAMPEARAAGVGPKRKDNDKSATPKAADVKSASDKAPKAKAAAAAKAEAPRNAAPAKPENLFTAPPRRVDDLKSIKGVGPRLETRLNELGIYNYAQIAAFTPENFAWLDDHVAALFRGRGLRDGWADQAAALAEETR